MFISIANFTYYTIYKDVFNIILLGIFFDDQRAILEDGLSGKYFLSIKFLCFFLSLWICVKLYRLSIAKINFSFKGSIFQALGINSCLFLVLSVLMIVYINSGFTLGNKSLDQELKPVSNLFLRKITPSPFRSLYQVYNGYKAGSKTSFSFFVSKTPIQTAQDFFGIPLFKGDLTEALKQTSTRPNNAPKVDHIFYIVAESLGSYAFDSKYDEINLVSGMKSLIDNQKGFLVKNFFENAHGTIWSIESQISGLYYTGVRLSLKSAGLKKLPTAPAVNFKRAGFATYFYYGGSETWQNISDFSKSQGFDIGFGTSAMEDFAKNKSYFEPYRNVWGVWDNILLDFVANQASQSEKPSFNMILTTSFHGPLNLPWEYIQEIGGKKEDFENFVKKNPQWGALELAILWWVDKSILRFVNQVSKQFPNSIFVITGDHSHYAFAPNYQSSREVPMLIYSPSIPLRQLSDVGCHLDISATLLNLSTPNGFEFFSFGKPLFAISDSHSKSFNHQFVAFELSGDSDIVYTQHQQEIDLKTGIMQNIVDLQKSKIFLNRIQEGSALSWYLFSKGTKIENQ